MHTTVISHPMLANARMTAKREVKLLPMITTLYSKTFDTSFFRNHFEAGFHIYL